MYKIGFDNHNLYIADNLTNCNILTIGKKKVASHICKKTDKIFDIIEDLKNSKFKHHIAYYHDLEALFNQICSRYKVVIAAGGLVINEKNQILFIFRNGKWDLPKGKLDKGESIEECAVREVQEECAIKIDQVIRPLITTYHTYSHNAKKNLKENHWYLMKANSDQKLTPQLEENIEKCEWKELSEVETLLKNSYSSIADVLKTYENSINTIVTKY